MANALSYLTPAAARLYAGLTDEAKASVARKVEIVGPLLRVEKQRGRAIAELAERIGVAAVTVYRWMRQVQAGDLHGMIDKRRDSKLWNTQAAVALPREDIALWHAYALRNQRKLAPAHRALARDFRAGRVASTQPLDPRTQLPAGWTYRNLCLHAPSAYELASARQGRFAASAHRPQVLTTRVGLRVGQYYIGDDVWHDHLVHFPGHRTPVRPVEASVIDLASAAQIHWGLRPRTTRADGSRENLAEREVRWIVAATLRDRGYRGDEKGTTWLVEHGTFAIREPLARALHDAFGIAVETSGIMHEAAWLGAFGGKGGGNPRFKGALESLHNLRHNELAALPGQVGKDRDHKPDELAALTRYAEQIDDVGRRLAQVAPQAADLLRRPVMIYADFLALVDQVYGLINEREDHALEGWRESGHETVQYILGERLLDQDHFLALPVPPGADHRAWGRALAEAGQTKTRLLTPGEVWRKQRHELTRLPTHGVALLLGPDLGREQRLEAGEFVWEDAQLGPGEWRYYGEITTPEGRRELLRNGETYLVHANPFASAELCVSDAKGRFLGVARRHERANRADAAALAKQFGEVRHHEAELRAELARKAAPLTRERIELVRHNAEVLDAVLDGPANRRAARRDASLADAAEAALAHNYLPPDGGA